MQGSKRRLGVKILEFMGADIMVEVRRRPQWRSNLETTREWQACRVQRQAA
jgi:hypothetical protein